MRDDAEFTAFAEAAAVRLRQIAYLMCRDWHLAQDLTQTTLTKLYVAWHRVNHKDGDPFLYARRILLNSLLDHRRRRSSTELAADRLPDLPRTADPTDVRLTLLGALALLPRRSRAIVILRYWEDHSVAVTAEILGVNESVVKSQSMRALATLREHLGEDRELFFS
ncbi:sigma-70 family RNA polymerase sigma factor [Kitasatospora sp. NPDC048540]|uniref:sigma-70 family RNA polymerase sigma factor n=1 Tax=unclassified Kitasatospora TaxID=2633591 RepID=UPI00053A06C9|nr:sigma-70 family RNA polymerase sigma factor [Kitasatospora sp. MBT63]